MEEQKLEQICKHGLKNIDSGSLLLYSLLCGSICLQYFGFPGLSVCMAEDNVCIA